MPRAPVRALVVTAAAVLIWCPGAQDVRAQEGAGTGPGGGEAEGRLQWLPEGALLPILTAGPRDPVSRADLLYVADNPTEFGSGMEAEFALAVAFPLVATGDAGAEWVAGVEAAAFARFGLHRTERELVNTDWFFTIPVVRWIGPHWLRIRYYHTSSHLGDEYARRFEAEGRNFARDALDATGYLALGPDLGVYVVRGWAFNVHPEESKPGWMRAGAEWGPARGAAESETSPGWRPFARADVTLEEDVGWTPRWTGRVGMQAPPGRGRSTLRFSLGILSGPTPLGQFQGLGTTQVSLGVSYGP